MRHWVVLLAAPLLALLLQAAAWLAPGAAEALYSRRLYPAVSAGLVAATAPLPFAVADALVVLGAIVLGLATIQGLRARSSGFWQLFCRGLRFAWLAAGFLYLTFVVLWGLNYRRPSLAQALGLEVRPAPASHVLALAEELIAQANEARLDRREDAGTFRLAGDRDETLRAAHAGYAQAPPALGALPGAARPKTSAWSRAMAHLGLSGIFVPFTGEPLVDALIPEAELPFSASHELAHLLGWAREDEASYAAFLACRAHPDGDFRYSGWLVASLHAVGAVAARDPGQARLLGEARSAAVRRDIAAIRAWRARYEGRLARAGDRVNDAYLKAQGDRRGIASYGGLVDLMLAERRARRTRAL